MKQLQSIEQENANNLKSFMVTFASYYTVSLYLLFSVVDYIFYPGFFLEFLGVRIVVVTTLVAVTRILKSSQEANYRFVQAVCTVPFVVCSASIYYMMIRIGDPLTSYWAGLAIIMAGLSAGFAFSWTWYLFNLAVNTVPLVFLSTYYYLLDHKINYFLNSMFLVSISVVCLTGRWFYIRLSNSDYSNRKQLAEEIVSRNRIIEQKTQESIRLNALSKQFSPQIVQGIQAGEISLSSKIHRAEICAIFVDIKDSTVKFSTLDRDNLQQVIAMYMEDVMNIFLKYDVTIDKFLGDGVMGFTNNPVVQSDYIERAILAAVEIKNRIILKQDIYDRLWGSQFEVRIGLSSGMASVGFYGSDLHVKSYTAIGRVINLASRVNGAAPPNQVAITDDIITKLRQKDEDYLSGYRLTELKLSDLKGFEREKIGIFAIDKIEKQAHTDDESCPHGHGPLMIAQLNNGIYVMKCRYCDYVIDESIPKYKAVG
jgi:class 3 adenylate cyclase